MGAIKHETLVQKFLDPESSYGNVRMSELLCSYNARRIADGGSQQN